MRAANSDEWRETLEHLLDASTPDLLIEALSVIATEKADHVRTNWQDDETARQWERIAKSLDKESLRLLKIGNPYS